MVDAIRRAGASKVYIQLGLTRPEQIAALQAEGFVPDRTEATGRFALMVDGR